MLKSFQHTIDEPDIPTAITRTRTLLARADAVWEQAVQTTLQHKITTVNGQAVIRPEVISEARRTEAVNGQSVQRPIIDLVQQGGGMYGIALVGYTYIMEKAGLRFYSLGGTSAGGINAMLLATLPNSVYESESPINAGQTGNKSELLAYIISNTNFSKFMDRGGIAGKLQTALLRNMNSLQLRILGLLFMVGLPIAAYSLFSFLINDANNIGLAWVRSYDFVLGTLAAALPFLVAYVLLIRILGKDFGINTGAAFYDWMKGILANPHIATTTTAQLQQRLEGNGFDGKKPDESARLVLIASNLTYNRIVKFPKAAPEYWKPADNVNPAAYVRATMSIPFVFSTFIPNIGHVENNAIAQLAKSRFVDGGMLSNFPIREFHNDALARPRFPTFGVLLNESPVDLDVPPSAKEVRDRFADTTLLGYVTSFLSTFRNFYDNDFLSSNKEIRLRVVAVETKGYNWLDFWMADTAKQELFEKGARAAIRQLEKFDFQDYLNYR